LFGQPTRAASLFADVSNPLGLFDTREAVITFVSDTAPAVHHGRLLAASLTMSGGV